MTNRLFTEGQSALSFYPQFSSQSYEIFCQKIRITNRLHLRPSSSRNVNHKVCCSHSFLFSHNRRQQHRIYRKWKFDLYEYVIGRSESEGASPYHASVCLLNNFFHLVHAQFNWHECLYPVSSAGS